MDESAADGIWNATVRYGLRPPPELEERTFSFDTTGGTQHVTQSIATVARYAAAGKTAPDFGGAIGTGGAFRQADDGLFRRRDDHVGPL